VRTSFAAGLHLCRAVWYPPIWVITIEITNEHSGVREHREYIGTIPSLTGGFVHVCDMVTTDLNNITERSRQKHGLLR